MTALEKKLGLSFKNPKLLASALSHPSYSGLEASEGLRFQRFEFLGDSIINSFVAFQIYQIFPYANEGVLSRLRSILVSRKILAEIAVKLNLYKHLRLSGQEQFNWVREKIIADAFEAVVAAVYLDCGRKNTELFLTRCFKSYLNRKRLLQFTSHPKSTIQEYSQKKFGLLPVYQTQFDSKKKWFVSYVTVNKKMKTKGTGRTKQEAESEAALKLIGKLKTKHQPIIGEYDDQIKKLKSSKKTKKNPA